MVVLGNPPYANFGRMNRNKWILGLLNDYKKDLKEKKLNLDDDFIKFIRFAQWRIEKTGHGIVGFITNNSYIDGITHRRMRETLMKAFDEIYIFDLHGSSKKKERTPDGGKDENVFDITVGVSILLAARIEKAAKPSEERAPARVFHAELWGDRKGKYDWLSQNDAKTTSWKELEPAPPSYFFVPKTCFEEVEYNDHQHIRDMFFVFGQGVKTERDGVSVHFEEQDVEQTIQDFCELDEQAIRDRYKLGPDSRDWKISNAKADVKMNRDSNLFRSILYRPFDIRYTWYSGQTRGFIGTPGFSVMRHMTAGPNLAMMVSRQASRGYRHVFISKTLANVNALDTAGLFGSGPFFPLYIYSSADELGVSVGRRTNLSPEFLKALAEKLKLPQTGPYGLPQGVTPEDIFHYTYAVFHSPMYRKRYAEFLKIDFPRLPLTSDRDLFFRLAASGGELVTLHLMESPKLNDPITEFPVKGTQVVEKVRYNDEDGQVWINPTQYFGGVPQAVWDFHIGGYQVCEKWLKDRKGRKLTYEDTRHYQQIIVALHETIRLMTEIDTVIGQHGDWPAAFSTKGT